MRLYFNGCSHTYGDDLVDKRCSWPSVLSESRGLDYFNDSTPGGTNDRIVYRTLKNINDYDKFYIAWTYITRFTRYRTDNNYDVNFNVQLENSLYGNNFEFVEYGKIHYSYWYNELCEFKRWLQQIILLQNTFKQYNKQYKMIFLVDNNVKEYVTDRQTFQHHVKSLKSFDVTSDDLFDLEFSEITGYVNQLDNLHLIDWDTSNIKVSELLKNHLVGKTNHLLNDGHRTIAEYIIKHDSN